MAKRRRLLSCFLRLFAEKSNKIRKLFDGHYGVSFFVRTFCDFNMKGRNCGVVFLLFALDFLFAFTKMHMNNYQHSVTLKSRDYDGIFSSILSIFRLVDR